MESATFDLGRHAGEYPYDDVTVIDHVDVHPAPTSTFAIRGHTSGSMSSPMKASRGHQ